MTREASPGTREESPDHYVTGYADIVLDASATGRRLCREELDSRRALGERAARSPYGLRTLIGAHLSATRALTSALPLATGSRDARTVLDGVLAAAEQAVDAFADGYERARRLAVRQEEAARREFIDDLLHGRGNLGRLAERAEHVGLRLAHTQAVAVAAGPEPFGDLHRTARQVEAALGARFDERRVLLATKSGRLVCVAPGDGHELLDFFAERVLEATGGRGRVAVGRPQPGPGGVARSYEEALNALDLAERMALAAPVLRAEDLLVFPVLTRDRQALADLVRSTLGPLRQARGGAEPLLETLNAYFEAGCTAAEAARRLSLSVRALTYRLERIHRYTGTDPADPLHRYTLQTAVIGARLLGWPAQEV
ncbi:PucR family transcriptional regulator [Streptomyces mobaraensis]|uniref:PucR family transcriptional regulator n=1 Tax=Streptomyces mobaraensis TaxID=35621 RepID=UPI000344CA93|nr:helix-turn-helix domain-containing protein [Streptomyces mobaraensis]